MLRSLSYWLLGVLVLCVLSTSCNTTKYVPDGEKLLDRVKIDGDLGGVSHEDINDYVRLKPNVRILGFWRLRLHIYNMSRDKDNGWNKWLKKNGQPPVLYNSFMVEKDRQQLELYMKNRGYYDVVVSDTMIVTGDKKCKVVYNVDAGEVYRIADIDYDIVDNDIRSIVMADTARSLIKVGDPFDSYKHVAESKRISRQLNESGYYNFGEEYIYYLADSTLGNHRVAENMVVMDSINDKFASLQHRKAVIDELRFDIGDSETPFGVDMSDSCRYEDYLLCYNKVPVFHNKLLANSCFVKVGSLYRISDLEQTQQRFNSLGLFRSVSIKTRPLAKEDSIADGLVHLACDVSLRTGKIQYYSLDLEGTNSSGNLGGAVGISYRHNNLLRGAEVFNVKWRLSSQNQFARDGKERFYTLETNVEATLTVPNIRAPFVSAEFNRKRNPNTVYTAAYDYQRRPDFTKSAVIAKLGYAWRGSGLVTHSFTPIEFNIVKIPTISDDFKDYISGSYLQYSYQNHFIMSLNYSFLYKQQRKHGHSWYFRLSGETAGNVLSGLFRDAEKNANGVKEIAGIEYSQYFKADVEVRFQIEDFWQNKFVYRVFGGVGVPYGNSKMLPFEKSYFVGGANSIRAWPVRGLGPGSTVGEKKMKYHNQISDMRLEANMEYRFKMVSSLEGAIFVDAGNIWALNRSTNDPKAVINSDFYKQIAVGTGLGLRLNFEYFVVRVDAAVKAHDPSKEDDKRWVIAKERFGWNKINYNFAIGYPF